MIFFTSNCPFPESWAAALRDLKHPAMGGAEGPERSGLPALIEIVFRNGLGLGGVEFGALVEVVGEGFLGDLVCFPTGGLDEETTYSSHLWWPPAPGKAG